MGDGEEGGRGGVADEGGGFVFGLRWERWWSWMWIVEVVELDDDGGGDGA